MLLNRRLNELCTLLGRFDVVALPEEAAARQHARRSLVTKRSIVKGTVITHDYLTWKRPAHGISPKHIDHVVGRVPVKDLEEDTVLTWELLA